jgi:hypothetical protein
MNVVAGLGKNATCLSLFDNEPTVPFCAMAKVKQVVSKMVATTFFTISCIAIRN